MEDVYTAARRDEAVSPRPSHLPDIRGHTRRRLVLRAVAATVAAAFLCTMPALAARGGLAGPTGSGVKNRPASATAVHLSGTFDCYGSTPKCSGSGARCTSTISGGLQAALNNAVGGKVICLNSGSYGAVSLRSKSYSSDVIVQPVAGKTVTLGKITLTAVDHLRFSGIGGVMNVAGTILAGKKRNDTLDHLVYTACVSVNGVSGDGAILFDHDRFDNIQTEGVSGCINEGRLGVENSGAANGWIHVTNSHFGGSQLPGCSDGIQLGGPGAIVGPGNEFTGISQGSCVAHADPIQFYGGSNSTVTGNWFHDNGDGTGCMCWAQARQRYDHQQRL